MKRHSQKPIRTFLAVAATGLFFIACTESADKASTVNVTLREFSVTPDVSKADHGTVTFHVNNTGTLTHEFLVIRTDLAASALPTEANGSYLEDGPGTHLLDEIEEVPPGQTKDLSLDLSEGNYVLICNMVMTEGNTTHAHYSLGMRTSFTVN